MSCSANLERMHMIYLSPDLRAFSLHFNKKLLTNSYSFSTSPQFLLMWMANASTRSLFNALLMPLKKLSIDNICYFQLIYFCESNWFHLIFSFSLKFKNCLHRYGLLISLDSSLIWVQVQTPQNFTGLSIELIYSSNTFWICCLNSWKNKWMGKTPCCNSHENMCTFIKTNWYGIGLHSMMLTISIWISLKFVNECKRICTNSVLLENQRKIYGPVNSKWIAKISQLNWK